MRYKAVFVAGVAVGFVAGTRAGRETYDQMVKYAKQVAGNPKVRQATSTVQAKATELTKTAAAKAPDYAKSAVSGAASTVSQVPKFASAARHAASDKIPPRLRGSHATSPSAATADPSADGSAADGQGSDGQGSVNGIRHGSDTP